MASSRAALRSILMIIAVLSSDESPQFVRRHHESVYKAREG
jgi:hypothetical protein